MNRFIRRFSLRRASAAASRPMELAQAPRTPRQTTIPVAASGAHPSRVLGAAAGKKLIPTALIKLIARRPQSPGFVVFGRSRRPTCLHPEQAVPDMGMCGVTSPIHPHSLVSFKNLQSLTKTTAAAASVERHANVQTVQSTSSPHQVTLTLCAKEKPAEPNSCGLYSSKFCSNVSLTDRAAAASCR